MQIVSVGRALPPHHYDQESLLAALKELWAPRFHNPARLEQMHRNVLVGGRFLALPMEEYRALASFTDANDAWLRVAVDLGEQAIRDALARAGLEPSDVDHIFFTTVTGLAAPSVDARLVNRLGLRSDVKRTPIFGLGCVAGAAGIARAADVLRGGKNDVAVLLSVELCSLTLQQGDVSIPNLIASGLFGDGAAAVVLVGEERARSMKPAASCGPRVVATRSVFYPDTEHVMGWRIGAEGFRIVLSGDVPLVAERYARRDVDAFLADHDLSRADLRSVVAHPGGPKVLEALETALELEDDALAVTWKSLAEVGNLSSASVLFVLRDTMDTKRPPVGSPGLMMAMGPGFCSELVLLEW